MSVDISDFKETKLMSNCCGAWMYDLGGNYICGDCKEHCDAATEE
jgi:hypothetical protein